MPCVCHPHIPSSPRKTWPNLSQCHLQCSWPTGSCQRNIFQASGIFFTILWAVEIRMFLRLFNGNSKEAGLRIFPSSLKPLPSFWCHRAWASSAEILIDAILADLASGPSRLCVRITLTHLRYIVPSLFLKIYVPYVSPDNGPAIIFRVTCTSVS